MMMQNKRPHMSEQATLIPKPTETVYRFRVYGEPMQWRAPGSHVIPKFNPRTGKPFTLIAHPDSRVTQWQELIRLQLATQEMGQFDLPIITPVRLETWLFLTRPKTVRDIYPESDPDLTNLVKAAEDGLNGIIVADDKQVVEQHTFERWAYMDYPDCGRQKPGVLFAVTPIVIETTTAKAMNKDYAEYLKREGLEYSTEFYGRKKDKKRIVLRKQEGEGSETQ
jgi:Holliday junction resolvase RusA-like endonuclease